MSTSPFHTLHEPMATEVDDIGETPFYPERGDVFTGEHKTYACQENSKQWSTKLVMSAGEMNLHSWTTEHPLKWSQREVLDWAYTAANLCKDIELHKFRGENFNQLTGEALCKMSLDDFCRLEPEYGPRLFDIFNRLRNAAQFQDPRSIECGPCSEEFGDDPNVYESSSLAAHEIGRYMNLSAELGMAGGDITKYSPGQYIIDGHNYEYDPYDSPPIPMFDQVCCKQEDDAGYVSDHKMNNQVKTESHFTLCVPPNAVLGSDHFIHNHMAESRSPGYMLPAASVLNGQDKIGLVKPKPTPKRRPGRPRRIKSETSSDYGSSEDELSQHKTPKRPQGTHKGNHLWEFIRDLLKDPTYNGTYIRWENKSDGVFKIVNSDAVAKLWGTKKNNNTMTYEKFSRAMRFCRTAGYFADVPKNHNYPKKLCFRFGPKATGWQ